jgi:hypothetical protein
VLESYALVFALVAISLVHIAATHIQNRSVRSAISILWWLVILAVLVFLGVRFGWRVPVALIMVCALWVARMLTAPTDPGRLRTTIEFILFALIGMLIGIFVFGGVGGIVGFTMGVVVRLAEIPTTGVFRSRKPPANGPRQG